MEGNNKKSVVVIVILSLLVLGLGGYIIYDKLFSSKNNDVEVSNEQSLEEQKVDDKIKKDYIQLLRLSPIDGFAVLNNGEVYVNIYDTSTVVDDIFGEGKSQDLIKTREKYVNYSFSNDYVDIDLLKNRWMKLNVKNIKKIFNHSVGQTYSSSSASKYGIIMLTNDNKIKFAKIEDLIYGISNIKDLPVDNVKDVVSEDHDGMITYLILNNGEKINVRTLIE